MTQSRLAEACGVSVRTIRRAEQGAPLSDETVLALCAVLGCSPADLASGEAAATPAASTSPSYEPLVRAAAVGALLAMLVAVASFEIAFLSQRESAETLARGKIPEMTTLGRLMFADLYAGGLGMLGLMFSLSANVVPRLRAMLPERLVPGPMTMAVLCSMTTPFYALSVGAELAQGHVVENTVGMLGAMLIPASYVSVSVLCVHGNGALMRRALDATVPYLIPLGILIQVVGYATGDLNSGAFGTMLLLPVVLRRLDLSEAVRVTALGFLVLPLLQVPYVQFLLHAPQPWADVVTTLGCGIADTIGVVMAATRPRPGRASIMAC